MKKSSTSKYLTAKQLGITSEERDALLWVYKNLKEEKLVHVTDYEGAPRNQCTFNMATPLSRAEEDCGTAACIGGWMSIRMAMKNGTITDPEKIPDTVGDSIDKYVYARENENMTMADLFYPPGYIGYESIEIQEAAKAIENFLTTGKASWETVIPRD